MATAEESEGCAHADESADAEVAGLTGTASASEDDEHNSRSQHRKVHFSYVEEVDHLMPDEVAGCVETKGLRAHT